MPDAKNLDISLSNEVTPGQANWALREKLGLPVPQFAQRMLDRRKGTGGLTAGPAAPGVGSTAAPSSGGASAGAPGSGFGSAFGAFGGFGGSQDAAAEADATTDGSEAETSVDQTDAGGGFPGAATVLYPSPQIGRGGRLAPVTTPGAGFTSGPIVAPKRPVVTSPVITPGDGDNRNLVIGGGDNYTNYTTGIEILPACAPPAPDWQQVSATIVIAGPDSPASPGISSLARGKKPPIPATAGPATLDFWADPFAPVPLSALVEEIIRMRITCVCPEDGSTSLKDTYLHANVDVHWHVASGPAGFVKSTADLPGAAETLGDAVLLRVEASDDESAPPEKTIVVVTVDTTQRAPSGMAAQSPTATLTIEVEPGFREPVPYTSDYAPIRGGVPPVPLLLKFWGWHYAIKIDAVSVTKFVPPEADGDCVPSFAATKFTSPAISGLRIPSEDVFVDDLFLLGLETAIDAELLSLACTATAACKADSALPNVPAFDFVKVSWSFESGKPNAGPKHAAPPLEFVLGSEGDTVVLRVTDNKEGTYTVFATVENLGEATFPMETIEIPLEVHVGNATLDDAFGGAIGWLNDDDPMNATPSYGETSWPKFWNRTCLVNLEGTQTHIPEVEKAPYLAGGPRGQMSRELFDELASHREQYKGLQEYLSRVQTSPREFINSGSLVKGGPEGFVLKEGNWWNVTYGDIEVKDQAGKTRSCRVWNGALGGSKLHPLFMAVDGIRGSLDSPPRLGSFSKREQYVKELNSLNHRAAFGFALPVIGKHGSAVCRREVKWALASPGYTRTPAGLVASLGLALTLKGSVPDFTPGHVREAELRVRIVRGGQIRIWFRDDWQAGDFAAAMAILTTNHLPPWIHLEAEMTVDAQGEDLTASDLKVKTDPGMPTWDPYSGTGFAKQGTRLNQRARIIETMSRGLKYDSEGI